nr:MAG TPA: hypothetical protein [Caudoviricetes sp.]
MKSVLLSKIKGLWIHRIKEKALLLAPILSFF